VLSGTKNRFPISMVQTSIFHSGADKIIDFAPKNTTERKEKCNLHGITSRQPVLERIRQLDRDKE
jgi:hypothetical protein